MTTRACCCLFAFVIACTKSATTPAPPTPNASAAATAPNKLTAADVAKLKWIEGTWRGMDGDTPFYERYTVEEAALVVEGLKADGSPDGEPGRFELVNGELGKGEGDKRSIAREIGDGFVQFVPAIEGKGNKFRFERQSADAWNAILEWPAKPDKPARTKIYKMERYSPPK